MTERPILFSAPMVRALLAGTKTQTRRVVKRNAYEKSIHADQFAPPTCACPYGQPGDRLWVRETWAKWGRDDQCGEGPSVTHEPIYRADGSPWDEQDKWRPSIHMPRAASRILLEITSVRVERLQDISEADTVAEGIPAGEVSPADAGRFAYRLLWESINGPDSWAANPWVWVLEFKRVEAAAGGKP